MQNHGLNRFHWVHVLLMALSLTLGAAQAQTVDTPSSGRSAAVSPFDLTSDSGGGSSWARGAASRAVNLSLAQDPEADAAATEKDEEFEDNTGTDPRDFRNKFMPYYRYSELRNGLYQHDVTMFGLFAFSKTLAMTYEIPVYRHMDASEPLENLPFGGSLPPPALPGFGGSGLPDGDSASGLGDSIFRLFWKPDSLGWESTATWGPQAGEKIGGSLMPLIETTVPTHTNNLLGRDEWVLSPGFAIAQSVPTMGFVAAMFFYDFTAYRESDETYTSRARARIFMMQPLSKPGPGLLDGIYLLPEFQPIYDFRASHFSFWVGPEFGKVLLPDDPKGVIQSAAFYMKPGWGVNGDPQDREFTFEVGVRLFF